MNLARRVVILCGLLLSGTISSAEIIKVPTERATIQAAIDVAQYGDTVMVAPGTYRENIAFGGKSIHLLSEAGAETTRIESPTEGSAVSRDLYGDGLKISSPQPPVNRTSEKAAIPPPVVSLSYGSDSTTVIAGFTINGRNGTRCFQCIQAHPEIRDCIIENGCADTLTNNGAGFYLENCGAWIHDNIIRENEAYWVGGGIYIGSGSDQAALRIEGNSFYGNFACGGTAVGMWGSRSVTLKRNLFFNNGNFKECIDDAAVLVILAEGITIHNNTFSGNMGGIVYSTVTDFDIRNNIFDRNYVYGIDGYSGYGANVNLRSDYNDCTPPLEGGNCYGGEAVAGPHDISADPLFDQNYPGQFYLTAGSPCRNTGDPSVVYNDPDGTRNDMGAKPYTAQPIYHPVTRRVPGDYPTIQAAIEAAGRGDTVLVAPGTYTENLNLLGKSIKLLSQSGAEATIIAAPHSAAKSIEDFIQSMPEMTVADPTANPQGYDPAKSTTTPLLLIGAGCDETTLISGFTFDGTGRNAQGITVYFANPEIADCIVQNCTSHYDGAGIYIYHGAPYIHDNIVRRNWAPVTGGGIMGILDYYATDTTRIIGNVVYDNFGYNGPGIAMLTGRNAVISRNLVFQNQAYDGSIATGAVYIWSTDHILISNNTIDANLRGITVLSSGYFTIYNNIVSNNVYGGIEFNDTIGSIYQYASDFNTVWNNGGRDYIDVAVKGAHDLSADPRFIPCSILDGYLLSAESPCIDAGHPDPRYKDPDGSIADIGAVPYAPTGPCPDPVTRRVPAQYASIQAAIDVSWHGDTIRVAPGTYEEFIHLDGKRIALISDAGAEQTIIRHIPTLKSLDAASTWSLVKLTSSGPADSRDFGLPVQAAVTPDKSDVFADKYFTVYIVLGGDTSTVFSGFTIDGQGRSPGLYLLGTDLRIDNCIIENCVTGEFGWWTSEGSGLESQYAAPVVTDNIFRKNDASFIAPALTMILRNGPQTAVIAGNAFYDNTSTYVAAITISQGSTALIERNLIFHNLCQIRNYYDLRSALYFYSCKSVDIRNNTIEGNTRGIMTSNVGSFTVINNIIANNFEGGYELRDDQKSAGFYHDYNDFWNNGGNDYSGWIRPYGAEFSADPMFLSNYPGQYRLAAASPCINAGHPDPRYNDPDGSRNDNGARPYENLPPPRVPMTIRVPGDHGTIQAAIDAAVSGDTILVGPGTYIENLTFGGRGLSLISEAGPEATIIRSPDISQQNAAAYIGAIDSVFNALRLEDKGAASFSDSMPVVTIMPSEFPSEIIGFTIDGNHQVPGIYCLIAPLQVVDCIVENCLSGTDGAGLYLFRCAPRVENCIVRHNNAFLDGGGIYLNAGHGIGSSLIRGNQIYGNLANFGQGIYLTAGDSVVVERNLVHSNVAPAYYYDCIDAALLCNADQVRISNNTFAGNSGGIVVSSSDTVDIRNNIICTNIGKGISLDTGDSASTGVTMNYNNVWSNYIQNYQYPGMPPPHDKSVDPLFEKTLPGKYYLTAGSACIDAGDPDPVYNDPDGSRSDIGAMPYVVADPHVPVTYRVPLDYPTIQQAIDAALYGDTVLIAPGSYDVYLNLEGKSFALIGEAGARETVIRLTPLTQREHPDTDKDTIDVLSGNDPTAIVAIPPGSDTTTLISGLTIDGNMMLRGIYSVGASPRISECVIQRGMSYGDLFAGGAFFGWGFPELRNNLFRYNFDYWRGGAIYIDSRNSDALHYARLIGNTITGNFSRRGAGLYVSITNSTGYIYLEGNVISGNMGFYESYYDIAPPAAVHIEGPGTQVIAVNNTIARNAKGMTVQSFTHLRIRNNIICNNQSGGFESITGPATDEIDYNNAWHNGEYDYQGIISAGTHALAVDPVFDNRFSGGANLAAQSPCINAGDPNSSYNDPDGSRNDIGAVPYTPYQPTTPEIRYVPSQYATIQEAIDACRYGDTVLVAPGTYTEFLDFGGKSLALVSEAGAEQTIILAPESIIESPPPLPGTDAFGDDPAAKSSTTYRLTPSVVSIGPGGDSTTLVNGFTIDGGHRMRGLHSIGTDFEIRNCIIQNGDATFVYHYHNGTASTADPGGGMLIEGGTPYIHDNIIQNNQTWDQGGGMMLGVGSETNPARIINNRFIGNGAGYGYALSISGNAGAIIERNIFLQNGESGGWWGSVGDRLSTVTIDADAVSFVNNTVVGNFAGVHAGNKENIDVRNNIIVSNGLYGLKVGLDTGSVYGVSWDYNDVYDHQVNYEGQAAPGKHDLSALPKFDPTVPLAFRLAEGSPCIDAGDPDPQCNDSDGSVNDIGAVATFYTPVTRLVPTEYATVQAAISAARYNDTVLLAPGTYVESISLMNKSIVLTSQAGAAGTIIKAPDPGYPGGGGEAVITTFMCRDNTTISNLTIDGAGRARGISGTQTPIRIKGCIITDCMTWLEGGALYFDLSSPHIEGNTINGNYSGTQGAGIYINLPSDTALAVITDNTFHDNSAASNAGITLVGEGDALVTRNILYNNIIQSPTLNTGVIYVESCQVAIVNNTIDDNSLGIVVAASGRVDIRNNIITNNISGGAKFDDNPGPGIERLLDYNDIWNNAGGNYLGWAAPGGHDLSIDPLFRSNVPHGYWLQELSPCRDAGDPDPAYNDPDGSRADMGANPFSAGICGDANTDGLVNVGDVVFVISYVFRSGPPPDPIEMADVNGDGSTNVGDAVYLLNYAFRGGAPPDCSTGANSFLIERQ